MKNILVPINFSEVSEAAFRFALDLARKSKGKIFVLHALDYPILYDPISYPEASMEVQREIGVYEKEEALVKYKNIETRFCNSSDQVEFVGEFGDPIESITESAIKYECDLIVMGARQVKGLEEFFFGSHSGKMVSQSHIPTLFIKNYFDPSLIKTIIFPNSLEIPQDDLVVRIKGLQEFFNAELKVLYINTPYSFRSDKDTYDALHKFADYYNLHNYTLHVFGDRDEESGIANFRASFTNALIAMSTHGRIGLHAFLDGSIAKNLVDHFDYPIWTILKK